MNDNEFMKCMKFILEAEGGYVDDPEDPGGETKYGISKRAFPGEDIKHLTVERACQLYFDNYWVLSGANSFDWPLDLVVLDSAVLDGVGLSRTLVSQSEKDYKKMIELRWSRYNFLVLKKPALKKFLKGWQNRLNNLKKFIDETNVATGD